MRSSALKESIEAQALPKVSIPKKKKYKGKGIKFVGEVLRRKAGKSASKK